MKADSCVFCVAILSVWPLLYSPGLARPISVLGWSCCYSSQRERERERARASAVRKSHRERKHETELLQFPVQRLRDTVVTSPDEAQQGRLEEQTEKPHGLWTGRWGSSYAADHLWIWLQHQCRVEEETPGLSRHGHRFRYSLHGLSGAPRATLQWLTDECWCSCALNYTVACFYCFTVQV